jgi:hypothetical protein
MKKTRLALALLGVLLFVRPARLAPQLNHAGRVTQLRRELLAYTAEDDARLRSNGYVAEHLKEIRNLVRAEILRGLNNGVATEQVAKGLRSMLQDDWNVPVSLIHARINGIDLIVVGYSILHGGAALPGSTTVLEGFRNVRDKYEACAEPGDGASDSLMRLDELPSPRSDEMWFMAHGQQLQVMQYAEKIGIYSFDGVRFNKLWTTLPKKQASLQVEKDSVRVTFEDPERVSPMVLTVALTPAGPVEVSLLPKN